MPETSPSVQDYLKAIYRLTREGGQATTNSLAAMLGVAPASVTGMLKRLAGEQPPLVAYRPRRGATLTPAGERIALETLRRHRLLELFLVRILGYGWDEVHEEAERLEHAISARMEARIARLLGEPAFDPHGHPIPGHDLTLPLSHAVPLTQAEAGERGRIVSVSDADPAVLRRLSALGLRPGVGFGVEQRTAGDNLVYLRVEGRDEAVVIGPALAEAIFVEFSP
ncbi:MAG TPA: metal-dependent transcriptional regulator [Chloroflexi bacterium]|nr:metal-dependent transcriptional regulator [Chloroflexota bacterium]